MLLRKPSSSWHCFGTMMRELMSVCRVGFISNMTLGAVLSTGYHGSGVAFGALEDYVRHTLADRAVMNRRVKLFYHWAASNNYKQRAQFSPLQLMIP